MAYVDEIMESVLKRNPGEPEFHQAVREILDSIAPVIAKHERDYREEKLLERIVEPERSISFRVCWTDDNGKVHVNRGYRTQFNSALGPYKGGIRFHPSVNRSIINFLGFEQIFKNALTGQAIGGGKGGSDFNPRGKSDTEVMAFCQAFMSELFNYIGPNEDVPAGDIGVGGREIGYLYGAYKKFTHRWEGVLTGKGVGWGGSLARTEATGYGVVYLTEEMLSHKGQSVAGKTAVVSGSGNVALYTIQKLQTLGAKVVTASDSDGYIYDPEGIDFAALREIKEGKRGRVKDYLAYRPHAEYYEDEKPWGVPCDMAFPCATQNELSLEGAQKLVSNGCKSVTEGANMPTTREATDFLLDAGLDFLPGKAATAGGVAVSAIEMSQNASRQYRSFESVDNQLQGIMKGIFAQIQSACEDYNTSGNYVSGANIAGFRLVAKAMRAQGYV